MKYSKTFLAAAILTVSGATFAQTGGGNGNGGGPAGGSGNAHGAATAGPTANGSPASGAMSSGGTKMHHMSQSKKKPRTDSSYTPGADASSDTKGK